MLFQLSPWVQQEGHKPHFIFVTVLSLEKTSKCSFTSTLMSSESLSVANLSREKCLEVKGHAQGHMDMLCLHPRFLGPLLLERKKWQWLRGHDWEKGQPPPPGGNISFSVTLTLCPTKGAESSHVSHWRCRIQTQFSNTPSVPLSLKFGIWIMFRFLNQNV